VAEFDWLDVTRFERYAFGVENRYVIYPDGTRGAWPDVVHDITPGFKWWVPEHSFIIYALRPDLAGGHLYYSPGSGLLINSKTGEMDGPRWAFSDYYVVTWSPVLERPRSRKPKYLCTCTRKPVGVAQVRPWYGCGKLFPSWPPRVYRRDGYR
jgi:hypothetical protein